MNKSLLRLSLALLALILLGIPLGQWIAPHFGGGKSAGDPGAPTAATKNGGRDAAASAKSHRAKIEDWHRRLLAAHPALRVESRRVADADNGFLQWLSFTERSEDPIGLPAEIAAMVRPGGVWDGARFGQWLEQNRSTVDEVLRLGLLPDRSSAGIDPARVRGLNVKTVMSAAELLVAYARYQKEAGDPAEALRGIRSLVGSAGHFGQIEGMGMLGETFSLSMGQRARDFAIRSIAADPAADPAQLKEWRAALQPAATAAEFAEMQRKEWNSFSQEHLLPGLLNPQSGELPGELQAEPEAVATAHASLAEAVVQRSAGQSLAQLLQAADEAPDYEVPAELSAAAKGALEETSARYARYQQAWVAAQVQAALADAALAMALGETPPPDPVTGRAFVVDAETGTLRIPDDPAFAPIEVEPVKLPGRGR